ncbi:hypothetical protein NG701_07460 [Pseudarthrobacter sp. HLT3-5]|uniref:hypothetical protein n=1 Tax=Pseudarthrobacter cellobiosi TaxID=2953654 RepID=UPI00208EC876|nr:hypothetical protein [Pseudarthrobacter sp. HLT3-5]MCO4274265.1 hypothetical protein [Pseudarthrobacter sp. HLT3-5]
MTEVKRYAAVKKSSLAGLSEEWGDECYAYVQPATYADNMAVTEADFSTMKQREQVEWQTKMVKDHFISGKIKAFNGSKFELVDMADEDIDASIAVNDKLYADIMGFDLDPKDLRKAVMESALQTSEQNTTETTSSEESVPESPTQ